MPGLVIKKFPEELHRRLKARATVHHRSLTREALAILEEGLMQPERPKALPTPVAGKTMLTDAWLNKARRHDRA